MNNHPEFESFKRIPRLSRDIIVTEKIDGTNAQIFIEPICLETTTPKIDGGVFPLAIVNNFAIYAGSRNRWLSRDADNFGFAAWVQSNSEELVKLGPGRHYGEWWGLGIQRGYGQTKKWFSLFDVARWVSPFNVHLVGGLQAKQELCPECCSVVPVLYRGDFSTFEVEEVLTELEFSGSKAAPGYARPEGIVIHHIAGNYLFKKTIDHDAQGKPE